MVRFPDGRLHHVDEGPHEGKPVVMVHGNPTWRYPYRNLIGPSSRPATARSWSITSASLGQARRALQSLDLRDATIA